MHRRVPPAPSRRTALRGLALAGSLVAGALAVLLVAGVAAAPQADAAATATVKIRDLTPPLVSVDVGGKVTFVNDIDDKSVSVDVPLVSVLGIKTTKVVSVVVHTDVTLKLPSGKHELEKGDKVKETFAKSCLTACTITYTYSTTVSNGSIVGSVLSTATSTALKSLPQSKTVTYDGDKTTVKIGVPTPFLVNTILPDLPNLPSVNLPSGADLTVGPKSSAAAESSSAAASTSTAKKKDTTASTTTRAALPGYAYGNGNGAGKLAPNATGVPVSTGSSSDLLSGTTDSTDEQAGSGGVAGNLDSVDSGQLGDLSALSGGGSGSDDVAVASDSTDTGGSPIGTPALLAVIALAGASSALVKVQRSRSARS